MYFESAFVTKASALDIANIMTAFLEKDIVDGYVEITTIDGKEEESTLFIQPIKEQFFGLDPDNTQVVKCKSREGREVHLHFPPISLRSVRPAGVLVGIEPLI